MKPLKGFAVPRGPFIFPSPTRMAEAAKKRAPVPVEQPAREEVPAAEKPRRKWRKGR